MPARRQRTAVNADTIAAVPAPRKTLKPEISLLFADVVGAPGAM